MNLGMVQIWWVLGCRMAAPQGLFNRSGGIYPHVEAGHLLPNLEPCLNLFVVFLDKSVMSDCTESRTYVPILAQFVPNMVQIHFWNDSSGSSYFNGIY